VYDPLTSTYTLSCPHRGEARLRLSSFRSLERLPGPSNPAVYSVFFACPCGEEHPGLVSHDELDLAPLGLRTNMTFRNMMTTRDESVGSELIDVAATRIGAGEWPWTFFCYLEARPRPISPSAIARIAPGVEQRKTRTESRFAVAVRCPSCSTTSINVVSRAHVDVPFWNDPSVVVVDHVFANDAAWATGSFREELQSARFDERRMELDL
jgi:hypothetical protein